MTKPFRIRFFGSQSHNLKSKTCSEPFDSAQDKLPSKFPKAAPKIENGWGLFALVVTLAMCGAAVNAQQPGKIFRIGFLDKSTASGSAVLVDAFRQELRKLGWIEGKNITIEYRFAEQKSERIPELAADLVRLKVDLIVVSWDASGVSGEESDYYHPHRDGERWGPRGCRSGCQSGAAGRQCHRILGFSNRAKHQKAGDTQGCGPQARPSWTSAVAREAKQ